MTARSAIEAFVPLDTDEVAAEFAARLDAYRAEVEASVRAAVVEDFRTFGQREDSVPWGEAVMIVREGLCQCRGGSKPCNGGAA